MTDLSALRIAGRIATASDSDWDEARMGFNLAADHPPSAVAFVETAEDVAAVIRFAAERGLKATGQSTGHAAVPLGALDETILIKTERMRGVEIDAEAQTARVEAGVRGSELGKAAGESGLAFLPGSSPTVGVTGYTLGGGMSWLGRRYGFACNSVNAIELVTADGETRRVDAENEADLFWALRGGGGAFAIVTALHLALVPVAEVYAGALVLPAELGAEAVRAYRDWAASVPEEVSSIVRFLRPPPFPDVPEPLRDRPLLTIDAACIVDEAEGESLIAPLREIGEPIMDTFGQIPAAELSRIHMDPETPVPSLAHHRLIRELPDDAIEAFVGVAGPDSGSPLVLTELRQVGGALARAAPEGGALSKLDAGFVMIGVGIPQPPERAEAVERHLDHVSETMEPWAAPGGYYNFGERPAGVDSIMPPETSARLAEVKARWDPDGMIRASHDV
jgi:FAD/FMN-containing dehydrogenase